MIDMLGNGWLICLVIFVIYFPMSFVKDIASLAIFSYLGLFAIIIAIIAILVKSCYVIHFDFSPEYSFNMFSFGKIPLYFGVLAFAYDINGVVTEVHASMEEKPRFNVVLKIYIIV